MKEKYEPRFPGINGNKEGDFQVSTMRVQAAMEGKELLDSIKEASVEMSTKRRVLSIIIMALGDNSLDK